MTDIAGGALRTSSYTITVDLPGEEQVLLVQGYTGAFDTVSRSVADYVRSLGSGKSQPHKFGTFPPERPLGDAITQPTSDTISLLLRRGYLTEKSVDQEERLVAKLAEHLHRRPVKPSYILMPTYDCNLRCDYCFQDHMRTDPAYAHLLRTMSPELVDRMFVAMAHLERQMGVPAHIAADRHITLFGGEPLLEQSRPVIVYLIEKAREGGTPFISAVTNGTELQAYADLIGPKGISELQITLDGPPAQHDTRRIYPDRSGSFELIARNVTMALDRGADVSVRMNVDHRNVDQLPDLANEILRRGWDRYPGFVAGVAAVHVGNDNIAEEDVFNSWELHRRVGELAREFPSMRVIKDPHAVLRSKLTRLMQGKTRPEDIFKPSYCGAHKSMYVFDPLGDIYACWERTGDARIRIGHVGPQGELELNVRPTSASPGTTPPRRSLPVLGAAGVPSDVQSWHSRTVASNATCLSCRYAFYCGGGCATEAVVEHGEFFSNHCDGFQQSFRATAREAVLAVAAGTAEYARTGLGC